MKKHTFKKITKKILVNVAKSANIKRKKAFIMAAWLLYTSGEA